MAIKRTKEINIFRVMRSIWLNHTTSRIEIARALGLDKSTITNIVNDMISIRLVREVATGEAGPQGGRRPIFLTINKDFGCVLGFEIQPERYTVVVLDMSGEIRYTDTGMLLTSAATLVENFLRILAETRARLPAGLPPIIGVGLGVSGIVNQRQGKIVLSIPLGVESELPVVKEVADLIDLPLFLDNDANCCAWGEIAMCRAERLRNFLFALVEFRKTETPVYPSRGIGVGIGIVMDGRLYYGKDFSAGEFRSAFWLPQNPGQFSLSDAEMLLVEEDAGVRERFTRELSKNLALLANTFDLDQIFIGGDIEKYEKEVKSILEEEITRNWSYKSPASCEVRFSSLGPRSVAYGAAAMFLGQIFTRNYPDESDGVEGMDAFQLLPAFLRAGSR